MAMTMGHCMATSRTAAAPVLVVWGAEVFLPPEEEVVGDPLGAEVIPSPPDVVELPDFGACVVAGFLVVCGVVWLPVTGGIDGPAEVETPDGVLDSQTAVISCEYFFNTSGQPFSMHRAIFNGTS